MLTDCFVTGTETVDLVDVEGSVADETLRVNVRAVPVIVVETVFPDVCVVTDKTYIRAVTCDFKQCGTLTSVHSDEPLQPHLKLKNSK